MDWLELYLALQSAQVVIGRNGVEWISHVVCHTPSHPTKSKPMSSFVDSLALDTLVDIHKPSLWISVASIAFNPTYWNIVAQNGESNLPG